MADPNFEKMIALTEKLLAELPEVEEGTMMSMQKDLSEHNFSLLMRIKALKTENEELKAKLKAAGLD